MMKLCEHNSVPNHCHQCQNIQLRAEVERLEVTIKSFNEGINLCRTRYEAAEKRNSRIHNHAFTIREKLVTAESQHRHAINEGNIHVRRAEKAEARVVELEMVLILASVGSCSCNTKTDDHTYHAPTCRYRIIQQALKETA